MGILLLGQGPQFSQRSVINLGFMFDNSYPLINFYLIGDGSTGPSASTTAPWPSLIDANGWPNQPGVSGTNFGGSVRIPGSDEYTGKWVMAWDGDGRLDLTLGGGTWTVDAAASSNYVENANGRYSNATFGVGSSPRIVATLTGLTGPQLIPVIFALTDPNGVGAYLKNFKFYQLSDEPDLLAGKVFRAGFKQSLVNLNPSAIRFMNWHGSSASRICRFESRTLPSVGGYSYFTNWTVSPSYPAASGTNQFSVAVAVPTAANPKTTPASLTHGEIAIVRMGAGAGSARSGGQYGISSISNAASNPIVTTSAAHGLATNDIVVHFNIVGGTFTKLNYFPCKVTVTDTTHYTIQSQAGATIDTSGYGTFGITATANSSSGSNVLANLSSAAGLSNNMPVSGANIPAGTTISSFTSTTVTLSQNATGSATGATFTFSPGPGTMYWSIDVGARGAKPMVWGDGSEPATVFGFTIASGDYVPIKYDKNIAVHSDGAGNLDYGAWEFAGAGTGGGWGREMPLELMTALVNEVNALSVAQGINTPIHMWFNIPATGLNSMDPDYTTASDYAVKSVDVILNGANGYAGLTANAKLFVEYSNETWNSGGGFLNTFYLARMGQLRWPTSGGADYVDMYILRSTIIMRALTAAYGTTRIKRVLAGAGALGYVTSDLNEARVNASTTPGLAGNYYLTDALAAGFGTPIQNHDVFATATYFDGGATYYGAQWATDSASYATGIPANQAAAITSFVNEVKSGTGQAVDAFLSNGLTGFTATYAAALVALGKTSIMYEGGADWQTQIGQQNAIGTVLTAADSAFMVGALNSTQWRDAQVNFFNRTSQLAGSAMPSVYTFIGGANGDQRWAYTRPDSFGGTATEGQGLLNNPAWVGMGARNHALSV